MNKRILITLVVGMTMLLSMLSMPVQAQEDEAIPVVEVIPVSGSFNYSWTDLAIGESSGSLFVAATEDEVWVGDFEGTAVSPFPFVMSPSGEQEAWLLTEFEGTVLGEYEGTLVMIAIYERPDGSAEWQGRWMIVSGTDDLENLQGNGIAWGPGSTNEDDGIVDIFYTGEVMFLEPLS